MNILFHGMDGLVDSITDNKLIGRLRDEKDAFETSFNNHGSNELSLVVMQTKKTVFFFVVPSKTFDKSLSMKLVNVFQNRNWTHTHDYPQAPADYLPVESYKIGFVRLGENRKIESNFSKSFDYKFDL